MLILRPVRWHMPTASCGPVPREWEGIDAPGRTIRVVLTAIS